MGPVRIGLALVLVLGPAHLEGQTPGLSVAVTAAPTVNPGGVVILTLRVTNSSATDILNPVAGIFSDTFVDAVGPPGWTFRHFFECELYDCNRRTVGFRSTVLPAGSSTVFTIRVPVRAAVGASISYCGILVVPYFFPLADTCTTVTVAGSGPLPSAPSALSLLGRADTSGPASSWGKDLTYDPMNNIYLATNFRRVSPESIGPLAVSLIDTAGNPVSALVDLEPPPSSNNDASGIPRVAYSPHLAIGVRSGGFMLTWLKQGVVYARGLSSPDFTLGTAGTLGTGVRGAHPQTKNSVIAYSDTSRIFLVVWQDCPFEPANPCRLQARRVGLDGQPIGPIFDLDLDSASTPEIVWNPVTDEFGVVYRSANDVRFARVSTTGIVLNRTVIHASFQSQFVNVSPDIAVNSALGSYVVVWDDLGYFGAEIGPAGAVVSRGLVSATMRKGSAQNSRMLSYNPVSGTFLVLSDRTGVTPVLTVELNEHGAPLSPAIPLVDPMDVPMVVAHLNSAEWRVIGELREGFSPQRQVSRGVTTTTRHGGSSARLGGCVTADPFASLGGGACFNGGWLPPGISAPGSPQPLTTSSGCATPDPFTAIGGGTCSGGGWYPPGITPLVPPPVGCATPDPFVAIGGGTCSGGGWYPPGITPPVPPPVGCATPDPFVAIGGGVCVGGGWRPKGS